MSIETKVTINEIKSRSLSNTMVVSEVPKNLIESYLNSLNTW